MAVNPKSLENLVPFNKGQSGNPQGNREGVRYLTVELKKKCLAAANSGKIEGVIRDYLKSKDFKKVNAILNFISKILPKEVEVTGEQTLEIQLSPKEEEIVKELIKKFVNATKPRED